MAEIYRFYQVALPGDADFDSLVNIATSFPGGTQQAGRGAPHSQRQHQEVGLHRVCPGNKGTVSKQKT